MTKFTYILGLALATTAQSVLAHPQDGQGGGGRVQQQQRSAPVERQQRTFNAPVERQQRTFNAPVERQQRTFNAPVERQQRTFNAPVERQQRTFNAPVERQQRTFNAPVERQQRTFNAPVERGRAQFRVENGNVILARPEFRERGFRHAAFEQVVPRTEVIPGFTTIEAQQTFVRVVPRQIVYVAPAVSVFPDVFSAAFVPSLVTPEFVTPGFVTPTFITPPAFVPVDYVYQGYTPIYAYNYRHHDCDEDDGCYSPFVSYVNPYGNAQLQGVVLSQTGNNLLVMTPSLQTVFVDTGVAEQDGYLQGAVEPGSVVNVLGYYTGSQFIATAFV